VSVVLTFKSSGMTLSISRQVFSFLSCSTISGLFDNNNNNNNNNNNLDFSYFLGVLIKAEADATQPSS